MNKQIFERELKKIDISFNTFRKLNLEIKTLSLTQE